MGEDAAHVVGDRAHDEAVEEGDAALRAGTGEDAARRQELEAGQRLVEFLRPGRAPGFGLGLRHGLGHPAPAILDRLVDRLAVEGLQPVFHVPDLLGYGGDLGHGGVPNRGWRKGQTVYALVPDQGNVPLLFPQPDPSPGFS